MLPCRIHPAFCKIAAVVRLVLGERERGKSPSLIVSGIEPSIENREKNTGLKPKKATNICKAHKVSKCLNMRASS